MVIVVFSITVDSAAYRLQVTETMLLNFVICGIKVLLNYFSSNSENAASTQSQILFACIKLVLFVFGKCQTIKLHEKKIIIYIRADLLI